VNPRPAPYLFQAREVASVSARLRPASWRMLSGDAARLALEPR